MPKRSMTIDDGWLVHRPDRPVSDRLALYLDGLRKGRAWSDVPREFISGDFLKQSDEFMTLGRFLTTFTSQSPFTLYRDDGEKLRPVDEFTESKWPALRLALESHTPLEWPYLYNQFLFGDWIWDLSKSDEFLGPEQIRLLFLEEVDKERQKFERLRAKFSDKAGDRVPKREPIPETVRILVWRRDGGRCVTCGSQDRLEYDHIIPISKGGSNTDRNIQLLCEACNRRKSSSI